MQNRRRKIKILFFSAVNLSNGRGTEKVLAHFIENAPLEEFEIYLMESNVLSINRLDNDLENSIRNKTTKTFKFENVDEKFEFNKNNIFLFLLYEIALRPFILYYERTIKQRKILKEVNSYSIDIVYLGFNEYLPFLRGLKTKIIASNHNLHVKFQLFSKILLKLTSIGLYYRGISGFHYFPSYKRFITNSERIRNVCIPNGTTTEKFKPSGIVKTRLQILFVGNLEKEKGINHYLSIFYSLQNENIDFHVVGAGPLENVVRNESYKYDNLFYHGVVTERKLVDLYSESDIFLYPTRKDTYALVVLDALSSGLYVITSTLLEGVYDDFQKLKYLEYNDFNDLNLIANRIIDINKNKELLRKMKSDIHEYTSANYDWKIISRTFYNYINSLVD